MLRNYYFKEEKTQWRFSFGIGDWDALLVMSSYCLHVYFVIKHQILNKK